MLKLIGIIAVIWFLFWTGIAQFLLVITGGALLWLATIG